MNEFTMSSTDILVTGNVAAWWKKNFVDSDSGGSVFKTQIMQNSQ